MLQIRPTEMIEFGATIIFLEFYFIPYTRGQLRSKEQNDSVDIYFDKANLKFQITTVEGGSIRLHRDKRYSSQTKADEAIYKYIINPVLNKTKRYGGRFTGNITLLIHIPILPPLDWLNPENEKQKEFLEEIYLQSGFKDIYLIEEISKKAICLFSRFLENKTKS